MIEPLENLMRALAKLPGLGQRSAGRAALALLREQERLLVPLVSSLINARDTVTYCPQCGAFTQKNQIPCSLCSNPSRSSDIICVVEEPADVLTVDASGAFKGKYHVLGGKLSPVKHVGPEKLRISELKDRIARENIAEILLALSTDMEGDATVGYIVETLRNFPSPSNAVKVTRLAFGLPADSGVAYSDPLTLKRAILHRCDA